MGLARRQPCVQHDSPVSLGAVATQDNNLWVDGAAALRPALQKLTNLEYLYLQGACGDVQRRVRSVRACRSVLVRGEGWTSGGGL